MISLVYMDEASLDVEHEELELAGVTNSPFVLRAVFDFRFGSSTRFLGA